MGSMDSHEARERFTPRHCPTKCAWAGLFLHIFLCGAYLFLIPTGRVKQRRSVLTLLNHVTISIVRINSLRSNN